MRISELPQAEFDRILATVGLPLECGPFVVRLCSGSAAVSAGVRFHYGAFEVSPPDTFIDFDIKLEAPSRLRRLVRPQVNFFCDGQVPFKPLPAAQAFPMLEWGLNWVISSHAHDFLVLHGAVVERDGRALILAADPGSGKSTLCAALVSRGWRLLSDELALVHLRSGELHSIARPVSLKNESIAVVRELAGATCVGEVCRGTTKGDVAHMRPPNASVELRRKSALPAWVVFPEFSRGATLHIEKVAKAQAFMEMTRHAFNYALLASDGFNALADLVDQCEFTRMRFGHLEQALPVVDDLVSMPAS